MKTGVAFHIRGVLVFGLAALLQSTRMKKPPETSFEAHPVRIMTLNTAWEAALPRYWEDRPVGIAATNCRKKFFELAAAAEGGADSVINPCMEHIIGHVRNHMWRLFDFILLQETGSPGSAFNAKIDELARRHRYGRLAPVGEKAEHYQLRGGTVKAEDVKFFQYNAVVYYRTSRWKKLDEQFTEWVEMKDGEPDPTLIGARPIGLVLLQANSPIAETQLPEGKKNVLVISAHAPWPEHGWEWKRDEEKPVGQKKPGGSKSTIGTFSNARLKSEFNDQVQQCLGKFNQQHLAEVGLVVLGGDFNRQIDGDSERFVLSLPSQAGEEQVVIAVPEAAEGQMTFVDYDDSNVDDAGARPPMPHYPFWESSADLDKEVTDGKAGTDLVLFGTPSGHQYDVLAYVVEPWETSDNVSWPEKAASDHLYVDVELVLKSK